MSLSPLPPTIKDLPLVKWLSDLRASFASVLGRIETLESAVDTLENAEDGETLEASSGYETAWHPYNKLTEAGSEDGTIYDFSADGVIASVVTPEFEDGWEYRIRFEEVINNSPGVSDRTVRLEVYRAIDDDYFPTSLGIPALSGMDSNGEIWGEIIIRRPRFVSQIKMYAWEGGLSGPVAFGDTGVIDVSTAQKITRARLTLNGRSFGGGRIFMDRRRDYTSA